MTVPVAGEDSPVRDWRVESTEVTAYDVQFSEPLLDKSNVDLLVGGRTPGRRFVIVDDGLPASCQEDVRTYFEAHEIEVNIHQLVGGEACKHTEQILELAAAMETFGVERREEPVLVIGGGAVLDAGSFAASIYRRGVPFVRVPTTLLALVDASIGVKTGVNFAGRKNLIGTFSAPLAVLLDRGFLHSLPAAEISSGMGEVLKLAVGCDASLFSFLEREADEVGVEWLSGPAGESVLSRSIELMLGELEQNLNEDDLQRIVDIGHTFSQAFEMSASAGVVRHGEAVAFDLILSAELAAGRGMLADNEVERLRSVTRRLGLPEQPPAIEPALLFDSLAERTRHRGGRQHVPLPFQLGQCVFVDDLTPVEVGRALERYLGRISG